MKLAVLQKASPMIDKAKFVLNKKSPEIWLGAGVLAIIGGTIWACHASRKLDEVLYEREEKIEYLDRLVADDDKFIEDAKFNGDPYNEEEDREMPLKEYKKQRAIATLQCAGDLAKLYVPSAILISGGIGMIIHGHNVLSRRNAMLVSAYATLDEAFTKYRRRVAERYGDKIEQELYSGRSTGTVTVTEIDENGKKKKVKQEVPIIEDGVSPYATFFDKEHSTEWTTSPTYNHSFLIGQQNAANDLFRIRTLNAKRKGKRGWVMLNEVLEMLGLEQTPTGAICGWLSPLEGEVGEGDDYIDFGFIEDEENGRFLLDFNCQGMIYDKI